MRSPDLASTTRAMYRQTLAVVEDDLDAAHGPRAYRQGQMSIVTASLIVGGVTELRGAQ